MKTVLNIVFNNFENDARVLRESRELVRRGYKVKVLAIGKEESDDFELVDGIEVFRLKLKSKKLPKSLPFQALKYGEYLGRSLKWIGKVDYIHCNDLEPLPIGFVHKLLSLGKTKVIYDSHEFQSERHGSKNGIRKSLQVYLEKALIPFTDGFITVSPGIAEEYYKMSGKKPEVVPNCPESFDFKSSNFNLKEELGLSSECQLFIYQGRLEKARAVEKMAESFDRAGFSNIALVMIGEGALKDSLIEKYKASKKVFILPAVPHEELFKITASADFGIVTLEKSCLNHELALPNKLFEYLNCGLPVLCNDLKEVKKIVEDFQCGEIFSEFTDEDIHMAAIRLIWKDPAELKKSVERAAKEFNWEKASETFGAVYDSL